MGQDESRKWVNVGKRGNIREGRVEDALSLAL